MRVVGGRFASPQDLRPYLVLHEISDSTGYGEPGYQAWRGFLHDLLAPYVRVRTVGTRHGSYSGLRNDLYHDCWGGYATDEILAHPEITDVTGADIGIMLIGINEMGGQVVHDNSAATWLANSDLIKDRWLLSNPGRRFGLWSPPVGVLSGGTAPYSAGNATRIGEMAAAVTGFGNGGTVRGSARVTSEFNTSNSYDGAEKVHWNDGTQDAPARGARLVAKSIFTDLVVWGWVSTAYRFEGAAAPIG